MVILGLLTGGVLAGKSLIRAAELRSVITDFTHYKTAVYTFEEKYAALPGDMTNATQFWGAMSVGVCPNATGSVGTETCNGDGDGIVHHMLPSFSSAEMNLFWQHLSNAGLIKGQYTGRFTTWGAKEVVPEAKLCSHCWWQANSYYHAFPDGMVPISSLDDFEGFNSNTLILAAVGGTPLVPSEAYGIDKKMDNGLLGLGGIITRERNGRNCYSLDPSSTVAIAQTATYNLSYDQNACELEFKDAW